MKHVARNDEEEGDEFCSHVCPKSQEKVVKKRINPLLAYAEMWI